MRLALLLALLAGFSAYTLLVMINHGGPLGFIAHAAEHAWGLQMLLDLSIMLTVFGVWLWGDARINGIKAWPYAALLTLGSPGALVYLVRRELKLRSNRVAARSP